METSFTAMKRKAETDAVGRPPIQKLPTKLPLLIPSSTSTPNVNSLLEIASSSQQHQQNIPKNIPFQMNMGLKNLQERQQGFSRIPIPSSKLIPALHSTPF